MHFFRIIVQGQKYKIADHYENALHIRMITKLLNNIKPDIAHFHHLIGFSAKIIPEVKKMGIPVFFTPTDFWAICPKIQLYKQSKQMVCSGPDAEDINCFKCYKNIPTGLVKFLFWLADGPLKKLGWPWNEISALKERKQKMIKYINKADRILPATQFLANMLIKHGVLKDRIRILPYGIDINCQPLEKHQKRDKTLVIGYIGTLSFNKGAHILLKSLKYLNATPNRIIVQIYGNFDLSDRYCRLLKKLAQEITTVSVNFMGTFQHQEMGRVLNKFDIIVIPSVWYEDTPLVLCSALTAKIPVVVSDLGGMTEIVKEGNDGFYFQSNNPHSLAFVIQDFIDDPLLSSQLQQKMTAKIKTMNEYAKEVEKLYQKYKRKNL
jgi:glycosyltransferase involved in cell wall biosynthesis